MPTPHSVANFYRVNHSPSPKIIGILGGGQLGLMLAQSVLPLGIRCVFLEDAPNCPARLLGKVYSSDQFDDFARACDVYTLEFENTPIDFAHHLAQKSPFYPPPIALQTAQDRLKEKQLFNTLGIDTVPFMAVQNKQDLYEAVDTLGLPLVLKTCRGGYDGKGQYLMKTQDDIDTAWDALGGSAPLIAEGFIDFDKEVSIIAVRGQNGDIRTYPLVENTHQNGILAKTVAPAPDVCHLQEQATDNITKLLCRLDYVGVLTLELFVTKDGLVANEIAPRVHNSGHWSIEGAVCSQFENHMRAVAGLPLGDTSIIHPSVMVNIIGNYPKTEEILATDGVHLHLYDKAERAGRKLGHITIMPKGDDLAGSVDKVARVLPNPMGLTSSGST